METIHADDTPLAAYLEGDGYLDRSFDDDDLEPDESPSPSEGHHEHPNFAPLNSHVPSKARRARQSLLPQLEKDPTVPQSTLSRIHTTWSIALNSRLSRADNAKFIEHFRYVIVASQLLNEYLDHGSLPRSAETGLGGDGVQNESGIPDVKTSLYGAFAVAACAFALVYLIHWARSGQSSFLSHGRVALALTVFALVAFVGYAYVRRQWLKFLRRNAVAAITTLTSNWQAFEISCSSALGFIQEVELVSKGFRLSLPLPPASRVEGQGASRRCGRVRKALHRAFVGVIPACIEACKVLEGLIDEDDLAKYFEVYDISSQDAKEASGDNSLSVLEDDAESLKSLRVLSYRLGVLRRVTLCSLMSLEADGGKPDFYRWRVTIEAMQTISNILAPSARRLQQILNEMETISVPQTPVRNGHGASREKMRSQVRKISTLSSGIRGLQAKMQILREETNRSIEQQEDLTDLGPSLMAQYESIGTDLRELMQAWESGKTSLQSNITKQERRISMASSGLRSPVSSIGGLTAVDEDGTPDDALKALNGGSRSNRSSLGTTPSDEEQVFEALAVPRQRSTLTREERIVKMQEERERQASLRAKRESNTNMLPLQTTMAHTDGSRYFDFFGLSRELRDAIYDDLLNESTQLPTSGNTQGLRFLAEGLVDTNFLLVSRSFHDELKELAEKRLHVTIEERRKHVWEMSWDKLPPRLLRTRSLTLKLWLDCIGGARSDSSGECSRVKRDLQYLRGVVKCAADSMPRLERLCIDLHRYDLCDHAVCKYTLGKRIGRFFSATKVVELSVYEIPARLDAIRGPPTFGILLRHPRNWHYEDRRGPVAKWNHATQALEDVDCAPEKHAAEGSEG
ncbi:hypothetical protein D0863_05613 [Hortaea werneckii]|uniref:Vezatin n=1 Tax=Hortaea werneckii TaxID=91943 RepID=A0A3M7E2R2_HORWE|nr:hypothetical protein D0863_05613 [Hortaea werneckii]